MYHYIFDSQILVLSITLFLVLFFSLIRKELFFGFRAFFVSFIPFFSVSYYFSLYFFEDFNRHYEVFFLLIIELTVLLFFIGFFNSFLSKRRIENIDANFKYYKHFFIFFIFLKIVILSYLGTRSGFGIFSETGSRIAYLNNGSLGLWLTYLNSFLSIFLTVMILNRALVFRILDYYFYVFLIIQMVGTVLSGSKGGALLWLVAFLAIYLSFNLKRSLRLLSLFIFVLLMFLVLKYFVQSNIGLNDKEFYQLIYNRFFLSNDGRALALDISSAHQSIEMFFNNTFRSISNVFGYPPVDQPIGFILYSDYLGLSGVGSNGSVTSLVSYYLIDSLESMVLITIFLLFLLISYAYFLIYLNKYFYRTTFDGLGYFFGINYIVMFSQDFLAFQITLYFMVLLVFFILFLEFSRKLFNGFKYSNSSSRDRL